MEYGRLLPGSGVYPASFPGHVDLDPAPVLTYCGNPDLLRVPLVGLLSSSDTPVDLILPAFDLTVRLREAGVGMAGGFQSELEDRLLAILIRGSGPLVVSPARSIEGRRVPVGWKDRIASGSMLLVSRFGAELRRPSADLARLRNALIVAISDRILVIHASPGSRAMRSAITTLEVGKPVYCFDHARNRDLLLRGAWPLDLPIPGEQDPAFLTLASPACR